MIEIGGGITISENEFIIKFSRSGGPGGQKVNKASTRVTLFFDVINCNSFSDVQKKRILKQLKTRVDKSGIVRVVSQRHRTQKANRQAAVERLQELLTGALKIRPVRKKTKVPLWAKEKRLKEKKQRSLLKKQRASIGD